MSYEWTQNYESKLVSITFSIRTGSTLDDVYIHVWPKRIAAGRRGERPCVIGTLLKEVDEFEVKTVIDGDTCRIVLAPFIKSDWQRLFVRNDADAEDVCKVKAVQDLGGGEGQLTCSKGTAIAIMYELKGTKRHGRILSGDKSVIGREGWIESDACEPLTEQELAAVETRSRHGWLYKGDKKKKLFFILQDSEFFWFQKLPESDNAVPKNLLKLTGDSEVEYPLERAKDTFSLQAGLGKRRVFRADTDGDAAAWARMLTRNVEALRRDMLERETKSVAPERLSAVRASRAPRESYRHALQAEGVRQSYMGARQSYMNAAWQDMDNWTENALADINKWGAEITGEDEVDMDARINEELNDSAWDSFDVDAQEVPDDAENDITDTSATSRNVSVVRNTVQSEADTPKEAPPKAVIRSHPVGSYEALVEAHPVYAEFLKPHMFITMDEQQTMARLVVELVRSQRAREAAAAAQPNATANNESELTTQGRLMADAVLEKIRGLQEWADDGLISREDFLEKRRKLIKAMNQAQRLYLVKCLKEIASQQKAPETTTPTTYAPTPTPTPTPPATVVAMVKVDKEEVKEANTEVDPKSEETESVDVQTPAVEKKESSESPKRKEMILYSSLSDALESTINYEELPTPVVVDDNTNAPSARPSAAQITAMAINQLPELPSSSTSNGSGKGQLWTPRSGSVGEFNNLLDDLGISMSAVKSNAEKASQTTASDVPTKEDTTTTPKETPTDAAKGDVARDGVEYTAFPSLPSKPVVRDSVEYSAFPALPSKKPIASGGAASSWEADFDMMVSEFERKVSSRGGESAQHTLNMGVGSVLLVEELTDEDFAAEGDVTAIEPPSYASVDLDALAAAGELVDLDDMDVDTEIDTRMSYMGERTRAAPKVATQSPSIAPRSTASTNARDSAGNWQHAQSPRTSVSNVSKTPILGTKRQKRRSLIGLQRTNSSGSITASPTITKKTDTNTTATAPTPTPIATTTTTTTTTTPTPNRQKIIDGFLAMYAQDCRSAGVAEYGPFVDSLHTALVSDRMRSRDESDGDSVQTRPTMLIRAKDAWTSVGLIAHMDTLTLQARQTGAKLDPRSLSTISLALSSRQHSYRPQHVSIMGIPMLSSTVGLKAMLNVIKATSVNLRVLELMGCSLTAMVAVELGKGLAYSAKKLELIDVSNNRDLGGSGIYRILLPFRESSVLKGLRATFCGIEGKKLDRLHEFFDGNRSLISLDLSSNRLLDDGVRNVMRAMKNNDHLEELLLNHCGFGAKTSKILCQWLARKQRMRVLEVAFTDWKGCGLFLGKTLASHPSMQRLDLRECRLGKDAQYVFRGAGTCRTMRSLRVGRNALNTDAQANMIKCLTQGHAKLTELNVRNCALKDKALALLAKHVCLNSTLVSLDVALNTIKESTAEVFGEMLAQNKTLLVLHLFGVQLNNRGLGHLLRGLAKNHKLRTLHLDGHSKARRWLIPFSGLLVGEGASNLRELTLRDSGVTAADVAEFLTTLSEAKQSSDVVFSLRTLRLDANKGIQARHVARLISLYKMAEAKNPAIQFDLHWQE